MYILIQTQRCAYVYIYRPFARRDKYIYIYMYEYNCNPTESPTPLDPFKKKLPR